ncbi:ATP/GTP-binding protein [Streptomyces sp. NPDC006854]|uniref:ATP/GTP-binding protein n=1 Tax=Streptomyces sp. NPDC006854 TaxID=3155115 RepID=UPI0033E6492E
MDTATVTASSAPQVLWSWLVTLATALWETAGWVYDQVLWLALLGAILWVGWTVLERHLALKALGERAYVELRPTKQFEATAEEILRFGGQLARAASAGRWWTPRAARTVRVRLRADGSSALTYRVEGPASAAHLLRQTPYAQVRSTPARQIRDKERKHTVRAVFALHGSPGARLRDVPLEPDPLQPLIDAVADLRADMGDLAEVCIDLSPASNWGLRARRWQVINTARQAARRESRREARLMSQDAATMEDALAWQVTRLLVPPDQRGQDNTGGRMMMSPRPPRVERDKVLGKLVEDVGLVRVQILVRSSSDMVGRAERRLRHIEAGLDIYASRVRLSSSGWSLGPWRFGPDRWPWRGQFDARWNTGLMRPSRASWARVEEFAGLLKPPTRFARLPLMLGDLPTYRRRKGLIPQGWHRGADGRERMVATREEDTLFEVQSGKAGWGKTMRALCQAVEAAHGKRGLAFVDPHRDSFAEAAPYLAHPSIMRRAMLYDLTVRDPQDRLACWNPLSMSDAPAQHEVVAAAVDGFASGLGWGDANAPRAITILTKAIEALVAVNAQAVAARKEHSQATLFQIRPLLSDPAFRAAVVSRLDTESARWWETSFTEIPKDALPTVLNPLDRLASSPVIRAFLGSAVGSYNMRQAMDRSKVVWICPAGTGPTDRLLVSLIFRDMLRAGLSRRDTAAADRALFRLYLDELISLVGAASASIAEITEQLRKFGVRMHGMTQLLNRLSPDVRTSLLQNASCLSTTAGSIDAIRHITDEWGDQVDPAQAAELDRYHHWASFTVGGKRVGPLLIRGALLKELFGDLARPGKVRALLAAAHTNTGARPLSELIAAADQQGDVVLSFLTDRPRPRPAPSGSGPDTPPDDTTPQEQYA